MTISSNDLWEPLSALTKPQCMETPNDHYPVVLLMWSFEALFENNDSVSNETNPSKQLRRTITACTACFVLRENKSHSKWIRTMIISQDYCREQFIINLLMPAQKLYCGSLVFGSLVDLQLFCIYYSSHKIEIKYVTFVTL